MSVVDPHSHIHLRARGCEGQQEVKRGLVEFGGSTNVVEFGLIEGLLHFLLLHGIHHWVLTG